VWWQCDLEHEWEAVVGVRTSRGHGCPVHSGQKLLTGYNDLATKFPAVAAQWHPTHNGNRTPAQVSASTDAKVWWRCDQGHGWEAAISSRTRTRTSNGNGCPVCAGRAVLAGYNDLGTRFPEVAAQWHPTRNGNLTPAQVSAGMNAKVWWRCEQGHEWETTVYRRATRGTGCPVCAGR